MRKTYLEYREGTSSKFWSATVDGSDLVIVYGKIGTSGRENRKPQANAAAAQASLEKEANKKRKKGYVDASADGEERLEDTWDALRSLKQFVNTFSGLEGERVRVQLLGTGLDVPVDGASRIAGHAPVGAAWPTSDDFASFEGVDAEPDDARQTHLMTLEMDKLDVAGLPAGAAISLFTPVRQWLPFDEPITVVVSPPGADLTPAPGGPPPVGECTRDGVERGVRISPAVEVPSFVFRMVADDFDEYLETYQEETEALADAGSDEDEREAVLEESEYYAFSLWAGRRTKLTRAQFEAVKGMQDLLHQTAYVGGGPLCIQQEPDPEVSVDGFHIQFGEELGINTGDCGLVYVGLDESSWDCN